MKLYSRNDCPLCEDVEQNLIRFGIDFQFIDIDEDKKLVKKYHVRVPVLVNNQNQELCWPFEESELKEFAKND